MLTPSTRQYIRRGLILIVMIATVGPISWKAGELFARRKAEATRQGEFEESRRLMEEQRDYIRAGAVFPDFALIDAEDSSTTSLHDQLRGGGMMVFVSPDCSSCDAILATICRGLGQVTASRPICFVADLPIETLRDWSGRHELKLPCFQDRDRFIVSAYDYTIIPFMVFINDRFEIVDYSTGGWSESDYARMLKRD